MTQESLSDEEATRRYAAWKRCGDQIAAAIELGLSRNQIQHGISIFRTRKLKLDGPPKSFSVAELPDPEIPADELWNRRKAEFGRRKTADDARKLIRCKVDMDGPIGVALFGDIHVDSPGCNLPLLDAHTRIVLDAEGMFAASVGDLQDGWVGRLARLWAQQGVTSKQALALMTKWLRDIHPKLLFVVAGNHDAWTAGVNDKTPLEWIAERSGMLTERDGIRISLEQPSGSVIVNARHDFRGRSQYNAAHGMTKAAMWGWRDDLVIGGHTHQFGYNPVKDPLTGRVSHPIRIASYKHIDPYAKESGLPDENISECPVALIDHGCDDPRHIVSIEFNPARAAKTLRAMRAEWKRTRKTAG